MRQKVIRLFLFCLLGCCALAGCVKEERSFFSGPGKRPVYISFAELNRIENGPPRPIELSGTIFLRDTLLFLAEPGQGIHVFDLKDSLHTINLAFFRIPAVTDFVISGNTLYADSWKDLVVIDISDLQHIRATDRILNVISPALYPPLYNGPFECVDEARGAVVGWEDAELENVQCSTTN